MINIRKNVEKNFFVLFSAVINAYFLTYCVSDALISVLFQGRIFEEMLLSKYLLKFIIFIFSLVFHFWMFRLYGDGFSGNRTQVNNMASGRESGMDLVRSIAALFVISVHHVSAHGYYQEALNHFGAYFATFTRWLFFSCVALYFTISGYFLKRRKLSVSHYLKLWRVMRAYIVICIIVSIVNAGTLHIDWIAVFKRLATYEYSGFVGQYVWLYCLIPFLNITWDNLTQRGRQVLIIVCICATSLFPGIKPFVPYLFLETYPITFYYIGAYIAEYKPAGNKKVLFAGLFLWLSCISIGTIQDAAGGIFNWAYLNISACGYEMFPNVVITTLVFLLLYNCNVRWNWLRKLTKQIATHTFEIYMFSGLSDGLVFNIFRRYVGGTFTKQFLWLPVTAVFSLLLALCASILLNVILKQTDAAFCKQSSKIQKFSPENAEFFGVNFLL